MRNNKVLSFLIASCIVLLAGCTDDSSVDETSGNAGNSGEDENNELIIATGEDVVTLDPHGSNDSASAQVRENIYEKLVGQAVDGELLPSLATEWEQVEDTVWNFKLREDTTFHNGSEFTAEDVKATLERVNDSAVASQSAFLFEMIEEVEIVGDYEVNIHTEYPFAPLPNHLSHNTGSIISKEIIDEDYQTALDEAGVNMTADEYYDLRDAGGDEYEEVSERIAANTGNILADNTDGTNHLKLESRTSGEEVRTVKFEDFQGGERNFDAVTFRVIPEAGSRIAELQTGGVHVIKDVDASTADTIEAGENTELLDTESTRIEYLGFNAQSEPFDDVRVRQAIAHAIDKEEILNGIYNGMGITAETPVPENIWGHDEEVSELEYDVERAQELLDEAGFEEGFQTTLWVNDEQTRVDTAIYIQESLNEIGIDVEIQQYEYGTLLESLGEGTHDMFLLGWTTVTGDADNALYALFHSDNQGTAGNRSFYENEEMDTLLESGRESSSDEERLEAYSAAQQQLVEEAPTVSLVNTNFTAGIDASQVEGIEIDPIGSIRFDNVEFK